MKKGIMLLVLVSINSLLNGQTGSTTVKAESMYESAMISNIRQLDTASFQTWQALANNFERIGKTEKIKWEPYYYAAYCYAAMAFITPDKNQVDGMADQGDRLLQVAGEREKNNSELTTLSAMLVSCRIMVDPIGRFQVKGKEVAELLEKAKRENPDNPRIYLLEAQMKIRTPEAFGGGKKPALAAVEKALALFGKTTSTSKIQPQWGFDQAKAVMEKIKAQ